MSPNEEDGEAFRKGLARRLLDKVTRMLADNLVEDALELAKGFVEKEPGAAEGWLGLGSALKKRRNYPEAERSFDHALELDPALGRAWFGRALCRALLGNVDGALEDVDEAVRLDPSDIKAMSLRNRLRGRRAIEAVASKTVVGKGPAMDPSKSQLSTVGGYPKVMPRMAGGPARAAGPRPGTRTEAGAAGAAPGSVMSGPPREKRFVSSLLAQAVVDEIEAERDAILVTVSKVQTLKSSVAVLQALTDMYEMDGVLVCTDRPPFFVRKLFRRYSDNDGLVHFIELHAGEEPRGPGAGSDASCPIYDLERLLGLVEEGLQRKADMHGGEDHFVMFDDVSALKYYHDPKALHRFFETLAQRLEEIGVVHVAIIAKEEMRLLPKWPWSVFKARVSVKAEWLFQGGGQ